MEICTHQILRQKHPTYLHVFVTLKDPRRTWSPAPTSSRSAASYHGTTRAAAAGTLQRRCRAIRCVPWCSCARWQLVEQRTKLLPRYQALFRRRHFHQLLWLQQRQMLAMSEMPLGKMGRWWSRAQKMISDSSCQGDSGGCGGVGWCCCRCRRLVPVAGRLGAGCWWTIDGFCPGWCSL